jgi:plastocyanin
MRTISQCLVAAAAFALAAACSDDGGGNPGGPDPVIAKTATNSGDGQIAAVTEVLPQDLRVIVTLDGQPVEGEDITWAVAANGGTVIPATATTDADGIALGEWTFGTTSGLFTATATRAGATGSPVSFSATAQPGIPAGFELLDGNNQSGDVGTPFGEPLKVEMFDQFNNPVPGETVNWNLISGSAILSAPSSVTQANGNSSITATFGAASGEIVIQAVPGNGLSAVNFNATANPLPTEITIQVQNNVFTPTVDTVAAGGTVTWTWVGSDHNVTPDAALPPASGTQNAPFTHGPIIFAAPGTYNYHCTNHPPGMVGTIVVI